MIQSVYKMDQCSYNLLDADCNTYGRTRTEAGKMAPKQTPPRAQRLVKGKQWALQYERLYDTMCMGSLDEAAVVLAEYQYLSNLYPKPCLGMKSPMDIVGEVV